jgi:hypothetical protein
MRPQIRTAFVSRSSEQPHAAVWLLSSFPFSSALKGRFASTQQADFAKTEMKNTKILLFPEPERHSCHGGTLSKIKTFGEV